jgi:translation initiation factor 2B subunit (eIF-2B alpha/beta/delta family)
MSDAATEQRLRAAGEDFTRAHENAAEVMVEARSAGFTAEAIVLLSGLSRETVAAFLRSAGEG